MWIVIRKIVLGIFQSIAYFQSILLVSALNWLHKIVCMHVNFNWERTYDKWGQSICQPTYVKLPVKSTEGHNY